MTQSISIQTLKISFRGDFGSQLQLQNTQSLVSDVVFTFHITYPNWSPWKVSSGDLTHGVCMNPTNISTSCSTYTKQKIMIISWGVSLVTITYKSTQLYWFTSSKCCVNVVTVIMNMTFSRQPEVTYHERTWLTAKAVIIKGKKEIVSSHFQEKTEFPCSLESKKKVD